MENNITYTISLYSENNVGLLNRVSAILLKRHINIESFSTSPSEIPNVFRFVIVVRLPEEKIKAHRMIMTGNFSPKNNSSKLNQNKIG